MEQTNKIILPGGAGLVGQNLVAHLKAQGFKNIIVLDKHKQNVRIMQNLHPDIQVENVDLAEEGAWADHFQGASGVVMLQAQIGGLDPVQFQRNNLDSTRNILNACHRQQVPYIVHVSSSVVESVANDHYTNTKKEQEQMVQKSGIPCVVLRPTLMFGWFDRKHLGWLSRFMQRIPVFPIPGHGRYMRQPLYAGDFSRIIISCLESNISGQSFNITGLERIDYIDIIRSMKQATRSKTIILKIPYSLFDFLLRTWALFDRDPPFTADQLKALTAKDEFEVIDWPGIFDIKPTPFTDAIEETFNHPTYSRVVLKF